MKHTQFDVKYPFFRPSHPLKFFQPTLYGQIFVKLYSIGRAFRTIDDELCKKSFNVIVFFANQRPQFFVFIENKINLFPDINHDNI